MNSCSNKLVCVTLLTNISLAALLSSNLSCCNAILFPSLPKYFLETVNNISNLRKVIIDLWLINVFIPVMLGHFMMQKVLRVKEVCILQVTLFIFYDSCYGTSETHCTFAC